MKFKSTLQETLKRVLKGGSSSPSNREPFIESSRDQNVGFRVVYVPDENFSLENTKNLVGSEKIQTKDHGMLF